jgi:type IV pilus assembly protein PilE
MSRRVAKGFSLIELMIVVAIIAILASLAYYNYSRYAFRARRADGREMLLRIAAAEERFFTNINAYTNNVTDPPPAGLGLSDASAGGHYTITVVWGASGDAATFVAAAAPVVGDVQANDDCGTLTYDNVGNKGWTGSHPPTNGNCW